MAQKKFNEEFVKVYENPSLLTKFDVEEKAHIELDPVLGDAMIQAKKVRQKMKDDFAEQDKAVDEFVKDQELEEKPELPEMQDKKPLKDMKLVEMLDISDLVPLESTDSVNESLEEEDKPFRLTEATVSDMLAAFEDKIEELEDMSEALQEDAEGADIPLADLFDKYEEVIDEIEKNESLQESVNLSEDYSNFLGKPLKDFLKTLPSTEKVNIDYSETSRSGSSGIMGMVQQVPWDVADRLIKDIQLGDENYYKFKILTEDKKKEMTEARKTSKLSYDDDESHRYKIVAADADSKELFVKDVKGLGKVDKVLDELTDEKLNALGATQLYVTRDDDKEVYLKFGNDDGSWDLIQDDRDMEKPAEERDTLFNHIIADLNAESTPDQKALRLMPRKGEGYVGFDDDEIGFEEDGDVFHLKSQSDKPINWAKKVAAFYGFKTSEVKLGKNNYKYIDIFAPGISKDPKLNP